MLQAATHVLVVDDEEPIRRLEKLILERAGYRCTTARDASEARKWLEETSYDVALLDIHMPGESGLELAKTICATRSDIAAVMVTGEEDPKVVDRAFAFGVCGYLVKPFKPSQLLISVADALHRLRQREQQMFEQERLHQTAQQRMGELRGVLGRLRDAERDLLASGEETILRLARAAECRDDDTGRHLHRMSRTCELLARKSDCPIGFSDQIRVASLLHDVGKIGIPDHILRKPGQYTAEDFRIMQQHTEIGFRILDGSNDKLMQLAANIAWTHHEKYDGTGYPSGLAGEAIPLEGRIAAIADVFDALLSKRVYKPAFPLPQALEIMRNARGTHFDPQLLSVFLASIDECVAIKERFED